MARALISLVCLTGLLLLAGCPGGLFNGDEDKDLARAEKLLAAGRSEEARQAFHRFVLDHPDSDRLPQVLFGLATVEHHYLHDYAQALATYRRLVTLFPTDELARRSLERVADIQSAELGDYTAAIETMEQLTDDYADSPKRTAGYLDRLGWLYFQLEDYDGARRYYELLLEEYPRAGLAGRAAVRIADSYYVQDRLEEALAGYRRALDLVKDGPEINHVRFRLANCLDETGRLKEARQVYRDLLKTYDNPEAVRIRLGSVEQRLKQGAK